MITVILCLRPIRIPKFIWFKILRDRIFEFGPEVCQHLSPAEVLEGGCNNNNLALVKWAYDHGATITKDSFVRICIRGNAEIVEYTKNTLHVYDGLKAASMIGNLDIVKILYTYCPKKWSSCMYVACTNARLDVVKFFVGLGAGNDKCFLGACQYSMNLNLVKYLYRKIKPTVAVLNNALTIVNDLDIVEFLVKSGATELNAGAYRAALNKNTDILLYLMKCGANNIGQCSWLLLN